MDFHLGATRGVVGDGLCGVRRTRPAEDPVGFVGAHVDTAVTHGRAEVFVPVGPVKCVADLSKEGGPRDAGQNVAISVGEQVAFLAEVEIAVAHVFGRVFVNDVEFSAGSSGGKSPVAAEAAAGNAGGNCGLEDDLPVFVCSEPLRCQIDFNFLLFGRDIGADGIEHIKRENSQVHGMHVIRDV